MAPLLLCIIIPLDMHGAKKTRNLQRPSLDQSLGGTRLEGSIELIHQGLHDGLKQLSGRLEDQFSEFLFEDQKLLVGGMLF